MNLMFLDECYSERVRADSTFISSMTAVIVPADKYNSVRTGFYRILKPFIVPSDNTINLMPPELHGHSLLRDEPDEDDRKKLGAFHQIVDLVTENQLDVYRVGYYITSEYRASFRGDFAHPSPADLSLGPMCLRQQLSRDRGVNFSEAKTQASGCVSMDTFLQASISESKPSGKATSRIELVVLGVST